ncbi:class I SAM-dependent methyltransferase [Rhizorhabdus histidinilytica]|uniref:class I SAM-dependent methyltransferase n=1 Tax=Rhizorhabdus histidinilytica TaxID=439228 RepID=UPI0032201DBD
MRRLEIGPGRDRLPGYETLNLIRTPATDHIGDCRRPPFPDATFDEVYSSHCIEHVEWYEVEATITEWVRILRPGGSLELHTVDGERMMRVMLGDIEVQPGQWKRDLHRDDPYVWAAGRLLNYAKGGEQGASWMHRAILTPAYLRRCFERAGLVDIEPVAEPKGDKKHRGINMGLRGRKP